MDIYRDMYIRGRPLHEPSVCSPAWCCPLVQAALHYSFRLMFHTVRSSLMYQHLILLFRNMSARQK